MYQKYGDVLIIGDAEEIAQTVKTITEKAVEQNGEIARLKAEMEQLKEENEHLKNNSEVTDLKKALILQGIQFREMQQAIKILQNK
jgi:hypothetical protein